MHFGSLKVCLIIAMTTSTHEVVVDSNDSSEQLAIIVMVKTCKPCIAIQCLKCGQLMWHGTFFKFWFLQWNINV